MVESKTQPAPDCRKGDCTNPARYQYEEAVEGASAVRTKFIERCSEHQMELFDDRPRGMEYRWVHRTFGEEVVEREHLFGLLTTEDVVRHPLRMDPHYFCEEGEQWCVDGYEESCPVHG